MFYLLWREDVWAFRLIFSAFYPFLGWVLLGQILHLPTELVFSFSMIVGPLVTDPATSFHRAYYSFTSLLISCYPVGLQADAPVVLAHFFINLLLRVSLAHFPYLYLFWALLANIFAMPAHFIILFLELP